jgi:hypothetical protein
MVLSNATIMLNIIKRYVTSHVSIRINNSSSRKYNLLSIYSSALHLLTNEKDGNFFLL